MKGGAVSVLSQIVEAWEVVEARGLGFPCLMERYEVGDGWGDFPNPLGEVDPYALISSARAWYSFHDEGDRDTAPRPSALVLFVEGWASKLDDEGRPRMAPSQDPERQRVRVAIGLTESGALASRMVLTDGAGAVVDTVEDEEGGGQGALAEALDLLGLSVWGRRFTRGLLLGFAEHRDTYTPSMVEALAHRVAKLRNALGDFDEVGGDDE